MSTSITPTTTLIVSRPSNFHRLETRYKLVRYVLPEILYRMTKKNSQTYGQVQNSLQDQLDCPYKLFKHDRLEGAEKWVVYALYPRYAVPITIMLPLFSEMPLPAQEMPFEQLDLYPLLSLLQIVYCNHKRAGYFTGQDVCYVQARQVQASLCLQIDMLDDDSMLNEEGEQEIKVIGLARLFQRVASSRKPSSSTAYFACKEVDGRSSFFQLKQSEIDLHKRCKEPLYEICTDVDQRMLSALELYVGKLLYDFLSDFSLDLVSHGIISRAKTRLFNRLAPCNQALLLVPPNPIAVFDHRLNQATSFQACLELLAHAAPAMQFVPGTSVSQPESALIMQDYEQEDFEPCGILAEHINPFSDLSRQYSHLPWQSLSVNPNSHAAKKAHVYLDYALPTPDSKDFHRSVDVALAELALKDILYYQRSVQQRLPSLPEGYIFIRKDRGYETLLYVEDDTINFLDLRDASQVVGRDDLFARLGVNWEAMHARMLAAYHERGELGQELACYDVIVGPDLFVELKSSDERVLYHYGEIIRRQASMDVAVSTEDLKLLSHYNDVGTAYCLPLSTLLRRGLLEPRTQARSKREEASLKFYHQLAAYDTFLDEVKRHDPLISFHRLTQGAYWDEIIRIFELQPDKHGLYSRGQFKGYYQKRGWFCKGKEKTEPRQHQLATYEGLWHDDTHNYIVGPQQPSNQRQLHAHPMRQFAVYQGAEHFDSAPLLFAIGAQYARSSRHMPYPYAFHLIDLYVESWLRYPCTMAQEGAKELDSSLV